MTDGQRGWGIVPSLPAMPDAAIERRDGAIERPAEQAEQPTGPSAWQESAAAEAERPGRSSGLHRQQRQPGFWQASRWLPGWWPLVLVLVVQAIGSARLLHADTAFQDEAAYLWAGHLEWAHWLHGATVPPFAAYFSGAPVIYPPAGALADSLGGLAAARLLSLAFMLGATTLLWAATSRLYGRQAGFFAAALFAVSGPVLHLGSFATFDAMSLFLVALATWLVVQAGDRADATGWMIAAGAVLALANATSYPSALLDPVVVAVAWLVALPRPGGKAAAARAGILVTITAVLLAAATLAGGHYYRSGIGQTTLARVPDAASPLTVLADTWEWTGLIVVLAICAIIISAVTRQPAARTWLLAILASAALLGPLDQARLHTAASLNKHVGLGAWFAAIAAGYAADRFIFAAPPGRTRSLTSVACVLALAFPLTLGASQSREFATSWPNAGSFVAILRPLVARTSGRLLVEDPSIAEYYLPGWKNWQRWSSTRNIVLPTGGSTGGPSHKSGVTGAGNAGTYAAYITEGYFDLVALNYADTTAFDHQITGELRRSGHYHIIAVIPYGTGGTYVVWQLRRHR